MSFVIAIPSHNRYEIIQTHVLRFIYHLTSLYCHTNGVYVFTTSINEYKDLENIYDNLKVVQGQPGLIRQRNAIRDYFKEDQCILYLDDDLEEILHKDPNMSIIPEIQQTFINMLSNRCYLCGIHPTNNLYFASGKITGIDNTGLRFAVGCCYMEINKKHPMLYHREIEQLAFKSEGEDFINTLMHFQYNGCVGRNDKLIVKHKYSKTKGGMNKKNKLYRIVYRNKVAEFLSTRYYIYFHEHINGRYTNDKGHIHLLGEPRLYKNNGNFKNIYLKKYDTGNMIGEYYTGAGYKYLASFENYKLYDKDTKKVLGYVIRNVLRPETWDPKLYYKFNNWSKKYNSNRGDIAGVIDFNKLPLFARKKIEADKLNLDELNKNTSNTRINKRDVFGYDISNETNCITLGYYNGKKLSQWDKKIEQLGLTKAYKQMLEPLNNLYKKVYLDDQNIQQSNIYNDTVFNCMTINKSLRSANHKDKNNTDKFAMVFHTSSPYENNKFMECDLLWPEYQLSLNLDPDRDIVIFDSKNIYHCNDFLLSDDKTKKYTSRLSFVLFSK